MHAVIACPGPSLLTADIPPHDLLVGVNRAPLILEKRVAKADTWVASDMDRMIAHSPSYPIDAFFPRSALLRMKGKREMPQWKAVGLFEDLFQYFPRDWRWPTFSFTAAIVYAAWRGAKTVDCIGCDWTDAPDADGVNLPSNRRSASRWVTERSVFQDVVLQLSGRGVTIQRIQA